MMESHTVTISYQWRPPRITPRRSFAGSDIIYPPSVARRSVSPPITTQFLRSDSGIPVPLDNSARTIPSAPKGDPSRKEADVPSTEICGPTQQEHKFPNSAERPARVREVCPNTPLLTPIGGFLPQCKCTPIHDRIQWSLSPDWSSKNLFLKY